MTQLPGGDRRAGRPVRCTALPPAGAPARPRKRPAQHEDDLAAHVRKDVDSLPSSAPTSQPRGSKSTYGALLTPPRRWPLPNVSVWRSCCCPAPPMGPDAKIRAAAPLTSAAVHGEHRITRCTNVRRGTVRPPGQYRSPSAPAAAIRSRLLPRHDDGVRAEGPGAAPGGMDDHRGSARG